MTNELDPKLYGLDDPHKIWPEDVLAEEGWQRGWFARKVLEGRLIEAMREFYPTDVGGTSPDLRRQ
jgi:hypothetical protein